MAEESKNQTKVLNDLRSFGKYCECFKIIKTSDNGEPDIFFTMALTGPVLVEMKRLAGGPEKLQSIKIQKLRECGAKVFVCHSWEEWVEIKRILRITRPNVETAHNARALLSQKI